MISDSEYLDKKSKWYLIKFLIKLSSRIVVINGINKPILSISSKDTLVITAKKIKTIFFNLLSNIKSIFFSIIFYL